MFLVTAPLHACYTTLTLELNPSVILRLEEGRRELEGKAERQKSRLAKESYVGVHLKKEVR